MNKMKKEEDDDGEEGESIYIDGEDIGTFSEGGGNGAASTS